MKQLKLFSDKEVFITTRPFFCTSAQKNELIEKWSNVAYDNDYYDLTYDNEEDKSELEKIFWLIFDMGEWSIMRHLEQYFEVPKEFEDEDAEDADEKSDEYVEWEEFISDIYLDIVKVCSKNIEEWVIVHDLKLTLNVGDLLGDKIIKNRIDSRYLYTYELKDKQGVRTLNGEDL